MTVAEIRENKIVVTDTDLHQKDLLLTLPGAKWDKDSLCVTLPLTWASCKQCRAVCDTINSDLEIGDSLLKWAIEELTSRVEPCLLLRQAVQIPDSEDLCDGLYDFQKAGARFLMTAQQAILADPMGAGKTCQAIAAARATNALPALIVCPNSTKQNWAREIERWWPGIPVYVVDGDRKTRSKAILNCLETPAFCIINWEAVRLFSRLAPYGNMELRHCSVCDRASDQPQSKCERCPKELNQIPWRLVVADEGHRMADPQSKQTRAVWSVGHSPTVLHRWALTGTPLTNTPETLYPILHFLNPVEWPSKTAFVQRYCDSAPSRWGPGLDIFGLNEDMKEEFFEIFDPRFRRMPKEVVLPNLPPIQRIRRDIDMSEEQARSYRTMAENMVSVDENGELIIAVNPISKLTRTIQYSSACLAMNDEGQARLTDPSCKLDQLEEDLDDYLPEGESIIVFAVHRQLIEMAEERLRNKKIPFSVIKGGQSSKERQAAIDSFQAGEVPVVLAVIAAGGVGINLQKGRIAIFLQRPWSNVDYQQALGRNHRIGSEIHESVLYIDYVARRTVENYQIRLLEGKAAQLEDVVRDAATIRRLLNGEDE